MTENEIHELGQFMSGPDNPTYARMIVFFSTNIDEGSPIKTKYLSPKEIKAFRDSMTEEEWIDFKVDFWDYVRQVDKERNDQLMGQWTMWAKSLPTF